MERRIQSNECRRVRPWGAAAAVVSIFLILSLERVPCTQRATSAVPEATLADAPGNTAPTPEARPAEGQDPGRITAPREPNAPLFAEPPREPNTPALTEPPQTAGPEAPEAEQIRTLNSTRDDLAQRARVCLAQLADLGRSRAETPQRQQITAELRSIHDKMCDVAQQLLHLRQRHGEDIDGQIAQEQERARICGEQVERRRAEMEEVQRRMDALGEEDRERTREMAAALDQTQREIRVMEQRLGKYGISYTAYKEAALPKVALARGAVVVPDPVPMAEMKPEPSAEPPVAQAAPPSAKTTPDSNEAVRNLQEQVRQLRAELEAANERQQALVRQQQQALADQQAWAGQRAKALENQPPAAGEQPAASSQAAAAQPPAVNQQRQAAAPQRQQTAASRAPAPRAGSAADRGEERRQQRLEAMRQQLQQTGGLPTAPESGGSPYSVGSANRGYRPNTGW